MFDSQVLNRYRIPRVLLVEHLGIGSDISAEPDKRGPVQKIYLLEGSLGRMLR